MLSTFQYGPIDEMNICDNLGDHLVGNVYIKVSLFITTIVVNKIKSKTFKFNPKKLISTLYI